MKLVLAGAQNPYNLERLLVAGAPNVLLSYFYMLRQADRGESILKRARDAGCWIIVDSGAFTFKEKFIYLRRDYIEGGNRDCVAKHDPDRPWLTQALFDERFREADSMQRDQVEAYLEDYQSKYVEWLKKMGHLFDAYAELDLDMIVGERIWDWRRQLKELDIKAEAVITPHLYHSQSDLRRVIVDEGFTYLGLEGGHPPEWYSSFFAANIKPLLKPYKVRVHGWGMTTNVSMTQYPFYSVDSTTWNHGMQYGTTYLYEGSYKISTIGNEYKARRRMMREKCERYNVDYEKFCDDDADSVNQFNACAWTALSKDLESYVSNAYWLNDDEKQEEVERARALWNTATAIPRHNMSERINRLRDARMKDHTRFCNTCFIATKCPVYEANATCAVTEGLEITSTTDIMFVMKDILGREAERLQFAQFAEEVQGTPTSPETLRHSAAVFQMAKTLADMERPKNPQGGTVRMLEITTGTKGTSTAPPAGQLEAKEPSLMERLFAGAMGNTKAEPEPVTVDVSGGVEDFEDA